MAVTHDLRRRVFERDGLACRYCGVRCVVMTDPRHQPPETATVDHLDPDGGDGEANLATACKGCNSRKHRRTVREFEIWLLRHESDETRI